MDSYVQAFQKEGGSMIMLAKGNPLKASHRCLQRIWRFLPRFHCGPPLYWRSIILKMLKFEYPELGMEAIWKIEVEDFPLTF